MSRIKGMFSDHTTWKVDNGAYTITNKYTGTCLWVANGVFFLGGYNNTFLQLPLYEKFIWWYYIRKMLYRKACGYEQ